MIDAICLKIPKFLKVLLCSNSVTSASTCRVIFSEYTGEPVLNVTFTHFPDQIVIDKSEKSFSII